jgi:hypothetical protein
MPEADRRAVVIRIEPEAADVEPILLEIARRRLADVKSCIATRRGKRRALMAFVEQTCSDRGARTEESQRVVAAKIAVALLPSSKGLIEETFARTRRYDRELQFSLLVFLEEELEESGVFSDWIRELLERYLTVVDSGTALAATKAGQVLATSFAWRDTHSILSRLATESKHVAGRMGALSGFLDAGRVGKRQRRDSIATVRKIALSDRSRRVREAARAVIGLLEKAT